MIRVLILDPTGLNPATWWRLYGPFNRLAREYEGQISVRYSDGRGLLIQELGLYDVVVFYITLNEGISGIVQNAKDQGCKVVLDVDDDVFNLDMSTPEFQDYDSQKNHLVMNFGMADELWMSTKFLCSSYHEWKIGQRVHVPNAIDPASLPDGPNKPDSNGHAVWRGSASHQIDYFEGWEWFNRDRFNVEKWTFFGYLPPYDFSQVKDRVHFRKRVPPERYFQTLIGLKPNYLWKPLKECRQNDAKSNISLLEATMAGAALVTNYWGNPGFETALSDFDAAEIEKSWRNSADRIRAEYDINEVNKIRVNRLSELTGKTLSRHGTDKN